MSTRAADLHFLWSSVKAFSHSAKISGGNSGGPAIEMDTGKVIGINFAGLNATDQNYAISGKMAKDYVDRMIKGENIHSIGISPKIIFNSGYSLGVNVRLITAGGKASKIGIIKNDRIRELGGSSLLGKSSEVVKLERYCNVLKTFNPNNPSDPDDIGSVIPIKIWRHLINLDTEDAKYAVECEGEINGKSLTVSAFKYYDQNFIWKETIEYPKGVEKCPEI